MAQVLSTNSIALGARANTAVPAPSGIANGNLLLCIITVGESGDRTPPTITPPAGFAAATGFPVTWASDGDTTYGINYGVYWKIASGESGSYTFTHTTGNSEAFIYNIADVDATTPLSPAPTINLGGDYFGGTNEVNGQTTTWDSITTPNDNSLVIAAENVWDDAGPSTAPTGTTPTLVERYDPGNSGIMYISDGVLASAGATGAKTHTNGNGNASSPWIATLISVQNGSSGGAPPPAKFADKGTLGSVGNTTANQASLVLTTATTNVAIGDLAVIVVAVDNSGTTDADNSEISGVTSSPANTWVKAREWTNGQGTAQTGATVSMWYTVATAAMNTGSTITAAFTSSTLRDAQGMTARCFTKPPGDVSIEATNVLATDAADPAALDAATRNIECLRIRGIAGEVGNNTSLTPTADWTAWANGNSATSGTTGEMCARAEHVISVAAGASSNPAWVSCDNASVYVAFAPPASLVFNPTSYMQPFLVR